MNANAWSGPVSAAIALLGVLIGTRLSGRSQHDQWLRDRRLTLYDDLLSSVSQVQRLLPELIVARFHASDSPTTHDEAATNLLLGINEAEHLLNRIDLIGDHMRAATLSVAARLGLISKLLLDDASSEGQFAAVCEDVTPLALDHIRVAARRDLGIRGWDEKWRARVRRPESVSVSSLLSESEARGSSTSSEA